jgi:hypothetical protein
LVTVRLYYHGALFATAVRRDSVSTRSAQPPIVAYTCCVLLSCRLLSLPAGSDMLLPLGPPGCYVQGIVTWSAQPSSGQLVLCVAVLQAPTTACRASNPSSTGLTPAYALQKHSPPSSLCQHTEKAPSACRPGRPRCPSSRSCSGKSLTRLSCIGTSSGRPGLLQRSSAGATGMPGQEGLSHRLSWYLIRTSTPRCVCYSQQLVSGIGWCKASSRLRLV